MAKRHAPLPSPGNRILAALPSEEYRRLFNCLEAVSFVFKETLYAYRASIDYVLLP